MRISDWSSDVCSSDLHIVFKEVVEMILHRIFDKPRGFWTGEPVLGLALELRVADKDRQHHLRAREDVLGLYAVRLLLPHQCAEAANPLGQRAPKAGFMRAAIRRGNGVAVKAGRSLAIKGPGDRPFDRALPIGQIPTTGEELRRHAFPRPDLFLQMIGKAAGELEDGACGRVVADQFRRALPADFDAPEKIGLRPGETVEPGWPEMGGGTENLREIGRAHV